MPPSVRLGNSNVGEKATVRRTKTSRNRDWGKSHPKNPTTKILNHPKLGMALGKKKQAWITSRMAQRR